MVESEYILRILPMQKKEKKQHLQVAGVVNCRIKQLHETVDTGSSMTLPPFLPLVSLVL